MAKEEKFLKIFTDGGSRGNPGESATGVVIYDQDEKLIWERGEYAGKGTNNEAEYLALSRALDWLVECKREGWQACQVDKVFFYLDSKLVVEQMNDNWKVKEPRMRVLKEQCQQRVAEIGLEVVFQHIAREKNKRADELVNQALDLHLAN